MSSIAGADRTGRTGGSENRYLAFIDLDCVSFPRDGYNSFDDIPIVGHPLLEEFNHLVLGDERLRRPVIPLPGENCSVLVNIS